MERIYDELDLEEGSTVAIKHKDKEGVGIVVAFRGAVHILQNLCAADDTAAECLKTTYKGSWICDYEGCIVSDLEVYTHKNNN